MSATPSPKLSRMPRVSLIWVVPVVTLGIAIWMVYREWRSRGSEITIEFADGSGVQSGQTMLRYKGVKIGTVESVALKEDLSGVVLRVQLERSAEAIAREGSRFWLVQPQIGFSGVSGLETLVSGVHLSVRPGTGPRATRFRGLDRSPAPEKTGEGRAFMLFTERLGGLQAKAPVYYRNIKVGEVEATRLADDATSVWIRIRIQNAYADLVRVNSRFWNAGGAPLQISLFGGGSDNKSIESIVTGAVAFATPEKLEDPAPDGAQFPLHEEAEGDWLKWQPKIPIQPIETAPEEKRTGPEDVAPLLQG